jgi:hypothetical protein
VTAERLDRLRRLADLRQTPARLAAEGNRRLRLALSDFEAWLRDNPSADEATRRRVLDAYCRRHDFPTLAELEGSMGGGVDG